MVLHLCLFLFFFSLFFYFLTHGFSVYCWLPCDLFCRSGDLLASVSQVMWLKACVTTTPLVLHFVLVRRHQFLSPKSPWLSFSCNVDIMFALPRVCTRTALFSPALAGQHMSYGFYSGHSTVFSAPIDVCFLYCSHDNISLIQITTSQFLTIIYSCFPVFSLL